jgi:Winged helix DNA-binding domain
VAVEGREAWQLRGERAASTRSSIRLLPQYDVYVIGCAAPGEQRERLRAKAVFDRGAGPFPALVIDGVVAGTWKREQRGKKVDVRVEPVRRLTAAERKELGVEAERIGDFLGAEPSLTVG